MSKNAPAENSSTPRFTPWPLVIFVTLAGCGVESDQLVRDREVADGRVNTIVATAKQGQVAKSARHDSQQASIAGLEISDLNAPLPDDAQYFTPPKIDLPARQSKQSDQGHAAVRLLGFIDQASPDPDARKAIVKVGDQLITLSKGETVSGIELINIQDRTITMQYGRDRWTLTLFDQPVVNQPPVTRSSASRSTSRSARSAPGNRSARDLSSGMSTQGEKAVSLPSMPLEPLDDLPQPPEIPEPPAIPEPPPLPDLGDLPGLPRTSDG